MCFEVIYSTPGMYLARLHLDELLTFVNGYNAALDGAFLRGFREWAVLRFGSGNNFVWEGLAMQLVAERVSGDRWWQLDTSELPEPKRSQVQHEHLMAFLDIFREFRAEADEVGGVDRILERYREWLTSQNWYFPGLEEE